MTTQRRVRSCLSRLDHGADALQRRQDGGDADASAYVCILVGVGGAATQALPPRAASAGGWPNLRRARERGSRGYHGRNKPQIHRQAAGVLRSRAAQAATRNTIPAQPDSAAAQSDADMALVAHAIANENVAKCASNAPPTNFRGR